MLSDDAIEGVLPSLPQEDLWWAEYGGMAVRDHYEHLITTGKLRVVVEVELTPNSYDCLLTCSGCGEGAPYYLAEEFADCKYCPGCGSIIKPTQQP